LASLKRTRTSNASTALGVTNGCRITIGWTLKRSVYVDADV
jgi:hypothetical protein